MLNQLSDKTSKKEENLSHLMSKVNDIFEKIKLSAQTKVKTEPSESNVQCNSNSQSVISSQVLKSPSDLLQNFCCNISSKPSTVQKIEAR